MVIGGGARFPGRLFDLPSSPERSEDMTNIRLVHYKPVVSREVRIETSRDVSREDDDRLKGNWKESVTLPD